MERKVRISLVANAVQFALIIGLVAGILTKADDGSTYEAIKVGGAALGASIPVILSLMWAAGLFPRDDRESPQ